MFELSEVLVPVDFSTSTISTLAEAASLVNGEKPVIVLQHVIEPHLAQWAEANGLGTYEGIFAQMRAQAEESLKALAHSVGPTIEVTTVVSEGSPFYEIVRLADELDVDAVVIAKAGAHAGAEEVFFGSTAERVVRACHQPVIVLPNRARGDAVAPE